MDGRAVNPAEVPLNRQEEVQPGEAFVQSYPSQYPGQNQGGQYPPLPRNGQQGVPIPYQPAAMRPMAQPQAQPPFLPPSMVNSPFPIWTRVSQVTVCPYCQQTVTTMMTYNHCSSSLPWLTCLGLFCSGFCLCCWVPFLCESCKDVVHICPLCRRMLGQKGMM